MRKPNVLLVMADQLTAGALRLYGNRVCRTPHMDALAARGTVFDAVYCNFPLCAPSRASMLTGRLASQVGVYDNACEFPAQASTLPYYLSAMGYDTVLSGKMHFVGPDQLHGYRERLTTDIYPSDFGWTPDWQRAIPVAATGLNLRGVVESGVCKRSLQLDYDDEVVFKAVQKLQEFGRRPREGAAPFFLTVSLTHPHNPYVISREFWDRYAEDEIDMPRVAPLSRGEMDPHTLRLREIYRFDEYDITPADVRRSRHAYYAMVSYVDDQLGLLMRTLRDMELEDDTVVVFTSDHGDMLGERGLWYKWMMYEGAVRVPLVIAVPKQAPSRVATAVSLVDLLPTVLELAGGSPSDTVAPLDGRSLAAAVALGELDGSAPVYVEMTGDGVFSPCLMVREGRWKYVHCDDDPPQLYDLATDADERHNLAGTAAVAATEERLLALVHARWDVADLKQAMAQSARERSFVQKARQAAGFPAWDYEPRRDPSRQFVRSGEAVSATAVKGRARFPFVPPKPPDRVL